ncbi:GGDEF domain-containing protein [Pantoea stewartii]|uniref:GGDEF domain-containing protein n=1 Tax=Pantoea stewartii TaxID=66269 RepID=UPI00162A00CB|nr:GGDEF domain-containing protein [Pantoea stewartii]MBC0856438.1 GGDEF domain-containing protein [Pantoea stewartii]
MIDNNFFKKSRDYSYFLIFVYCVVIFCLYVGMSDFVILIKSLAFFDAMTRMLILFWLMNKLSYVTKYVGKIFFFRLSVFLFINSNFFFFLGALGILDGKVSATTSDLLFYPGLFVMFFCLKEFMTNINSKYHRMVELSLTDELTGLANRRHLNKKLEEFNSKSGVVCIADIDHFKKINDTFGHDVGDEVLRITASKLKEFVCDGIFVSRSGGEEFIIIVRGDMFSEGFFIKLKEAMNIKISDRLSITLSIGIAKKNKSVPSHLIMRNADQALYKAKKEGRNRICLYKGSNIIKID